MRTINNIFSLSLALLSSSLCACDVGDDRGHDEVSRRAEVLVVTADDVAAAVAEQGQLVLDASAPDVVFEFQLGGDRARWDDVLVVVDGDRMPFPELVDTIVDQVGVDPWGEGSFQWTADPENFGTLDQDQIDRLLRDGFLRAPAGDGEAVPRVGGGPRYAIYDCEGGVWVICFPPEV